MKTKIFSGSVLNLDKLEERINEFCKEINAKNIMIQEASDIIICMVVYDDKNKD